MVHEAGRYKWRVATAESRRARRSGIGYATAGTCMRGDLDMAQASATEYEEFAAPRVVMHAIHVGDFPKSE